MAMQRIETNVLTGEVEVIDLTPEQEAAVLAEREAEAAARAAAEAAIAEAAAVRQQQIDEIQQQIDQGVSQDQINLALIDLLKA